jgi:5-formyltetrahydrofolate cyclo-ligase
MIAAKTGLRSKYLYYRNSLSPKEVKDCSDAIFKRIVNLDVYKDAKHIFCYMSMFNEVDTYNFIKEAIKEGKIVGIPKIENKDMNFFKLESIKDVAEGYCKILEPTSDSIITPCKGDLIIVPGIVFDETGYRIGYGGGFYDRYISNNVNDEISLIGVAYSIQLVAEVPKADYDQQLNYLATEKEFIEFKK